MKKITVVAWHSYATAMRKAGSLLSEILSIKVYSARLLEEGKEDLEELYRDMDNADLLFFYRSSEEGIWGELEQKLETLTKPVIWSSHDPTYWSLSNVSITIVAKCYTYITQGGEENFRQTSR